MEDNSNQIARVPKACCNDMPLTEQLEVLLGPHREIVLVFLAACACLLIVVIFFANRHKSQTKVA